MIVCVAASVKLFSSASNASDNAHAASFNRAKSAGVGAAGRTPRPGTHSSDPPRGSDPPAQPSGSPSPSVHNTVSGDSITAVGDSIVVAATPALQQVLPGIQINAMVGRQFYTGLQVIASLKASGQLRPIVVMALGTNGTVTSQEIDQLYAEIGPDRKLVLVNTFEDRSWEQEVNSMLGAAAADHPNTVLANWFTTIEHRTNLLWPDGIHPQPSGCAVYGRMLRRALEKLVNLPG